MKESTLRALIKRRVDQPTTHGSSLRAVAREVGISAPYLRDVVLGMRPISERVGRLFGFERIGVGEWRKVNRG